MSLIDNKLYYVGGYVRDEILGINNFDIDYCYEGDAISFAEKNGYNIIKKNPDFGTVRIVYENKMIDIASTRKEEYPKKGHLPIITEIGCSLKEDIKRRDFTINTLLKRTSNKEIIDYCNGLKDIQNKKIKVLHENSFIDDPTRIIRALKFSVRFNFELDSETEDLQNQYLNNINYDMSYHRLKKELIETFNLNKQKAFDIFVKKGLYRLLGNSQKEITQIPDIQKRLENYKGEYTWLIYLSFFDLSNFSLTKKERKILEQAENRKTQKNKEQIFEESIIINELRG